MNITSQISAKYPDGYKGGECGIWAHNIVDFPQVGDSWSSKKKAVQLYGVLAPNIIEYRIGDVLICSDGVNWLGLGHGHVCVVANMDGQWLYLAESNYKLDGKVHYGRKIARGDKRIYGVMRGSFKIDLKLPTFVLKTTIFMQYEKDWNGAIFEQLKAKFSELMGGKIVLDVFPLYTFNSLKNWWYQYLPFGGVDYPIVAPAFIQDNLPGLTYPNSNLVVWAINKKQWQGAAFGSGNLQELGFAYYGTKPCLSLVSVEQDELSLFYPEQPAFVDYIIHEIVHHFYQWGRVDGRDFCHQHYFGKDMQNCINDFDLQHLQVNLT